MDIKISSKCDAEVWESLKQLADENHQNISGLLTEAVRDYVKRRRIRPEVLAIAEDSMIRNADLGKRLAE